MDSDEALVARCRNGSDPAAFAELARRYREPLFRLAASILGPPHVAEAEDIAQEVLVRVHDSLHSFRGDAKFGSWVHRIAFNHALNVKERARYRAPHVSLDALAAAQVRGFDAVDLIQQSRRSEALLDCIAELPEVYQAAVRLYYWLDQSIAEIAVMLDVPDNTVKSYLHRARRLLHAMMQKRGFDE